MKKIVVIFTLNVSLLCNAQYNIQNSANSSQSSIVSNQVKLIEETDSLQEISNEMILMNPELKATALRLKYEKKANITKSKLERNEIVESIPDNFKTVYYYKVMENKKEIERYDILLKGNQIDSFTIWREKKARLKSINDSLLIRHYKEKLKFNSSNWFNFNSKKSSAMFDILYGADTINSILSALRESSLSYGKNSLSLYSEVINAKFFFTRASLGLMVTTPISTDSLSFKSNEAYQKLATKGGNFVLNFETPLYYFSAKNQSVNFYVKWNNRGTLDLPDFSNTSIDNVAISYGTGVEMYADMASDDNRNFKFFGKANVNYIYGNQLFKEKLGIANNSLWLSQATIGILIHKMFAINFMIPLIISDPKYDNGDVMVGGKVLR